MLKNCVKDRRKRVLFLNLEKSGPLRGEVPFPSLSALSKDHSLLLLFKSPTISHLSLFLTTLPSLQPASTSLPTTTNNQQQSTQPNPQKPSKEKWVRTLPPTLSRFGTLFPPWSLPADSPLCTLGPGCSCSCGTSCACPSGQCTCK